MMNFFNSIIEVNDNLMARLDSMERDFRIDCLAINGSLDSMERDFRIDCLAINGSLDNLEENLRIFSPIRKKGVPPVSLRTLEPVGCYDSSELRETPYFGLSSVLPK